VSTRSEKDRGIAPPNFHPPAPADARRDDSALDDVEIKNEAELA